MIETRQNSKRGCNFYTRIVVGDTGLYESGGHNISSHEEEVLVEECICTYRVLRYGIQ